MKTMTRSQMATADVVFQGLLKDHEARREPGGDRSNPADYYVYRALWSKAHGGDAICVVDDPAPH